MKFALIGCGRIAPNHIAAAEANADRLELAAVCDILPARCQKLLELLDDGKKTMLPRYQDYRQMLAQVRPNLVAIATESGKHVQIALDCIEAGCSVIVEKPIALSLKDADSIIEAGKRKGVKVCACHQNRFNKSIRKIRSAVESGRFGKMLYGTAHVRWNRAKDYYDQAPWRGTWAQDGGCMMNQCIHNIDLLRWMMGDEVDEVMAYTAQMRHPYLEAEDLGMALVKFRGGAYGIIEGTTNVYPQNLEETLYLFGETGTIKAGGRSVNIIEEWNFADHADDPEEVKALFHENPPNIYGFGHAPLYADVLDAIGNDREPLINGEAGKRALEMVLAIYKSAAEGRPVQLPLDACSTMDFAGRFQHA